MRGSKLVKVLVDGRADQEKLVRHLYLVVDDLTQLTAGLSLILHLFKSVSFVFVRLSHE